MPSKFLVPFEVPDFQGTPSSTADAGYVLLFIKHGWLSSQLPDGTQVDLVLQRPLDGFTQVLMAEPVTEQDTVLSALEKIQKTLSSIRLTGDVTGTGVYDSGELIIETTGGGINCAELLNCQVIIDMQGNITTLQGDVTSIYGSIDIILADIINLQGSVSVLETAVTTLQDDVVTIYGITSDLDSRVTTLENAPAPTKAATELDAYHFSGYGTQYAIGDLVYYQGHIYSAIATNDGVTPAIGGNAYWTDLGTGNRIRQILADWNATTGEAQVLNKPTLLSQFTNDLGFLSAEVDTLDSVTSRGDTTTNSITVQNLSATGLIVSSGAVYSNVGFYSNNNGNLRYTFDANDLVLRAGTSTSNEYARIFGATGNMSIGSVTDAGYKLDVNGWVRFGQDPTSGQIEFYPDGSGGATYSVYKSKLGSGLGPTVAFYGDVSGTYKGYGIYGPDVSYDGLLIYRETGTAVDVILLGADKIVMPYTQILGWTSSTLTFQPIDIALARSGVNLLEINTGTVGSLASLKLKNATVNDLAGTGTRMVVADATGLLGTQAIPTGGSGTVTSVALATGTSGTNINVSGSPITNSGTITLNIPDASTTARGVLTTGTQTIAGQKTFYSLTTIFDSAFTGTFIEGRASGVLYGGIVFSLFMQFNAYPAATQGFVWKNGAGDNVMALEQSGVLTVLNLAGSGTRMVVANYAGVLSTQPITQSSTSTDGYLSSTDWNTFNGKQNAITLTTTGTSGAATLTGSTLNIPNYAGSGGGASQFFVAGSATGLAAATTRFGNVGGSTAEGQVRLTVSSACTISDLYVRTTATMNASASLQVAVYKNGTITAVTLTIAGGSAAGTYSNTANSATFAAGDGWVLGFINAGSAAAAASSGQSVKITI